MSLRPSLLALIGFVVLVIAALPHPATAQLPGAQPEAAESPGWVSQTLFEIRRYQAELQRDLAGIIGEIKEGGGLEPALLLIGLSFLYGIFHAAGPGHGKIVISSYLLTHDSRIRNGVLISLAAAAVQAVSAILLVSVFALLLDLPRLKVAGQVRLLELASYGLIVALGLWMLYGAITGRGCGHAHEHGEDQGTRTLGQRVGRIPGLILAVGIRPCSGAVIVLLFTLANDLLVLGIVATLAMALGTGVTVSLLGIASVYGNKLTHLIGRHNARWQQRLRSGLTVAGALFITLIGGVLFLTTFDRPAGPLL